MEKRVFSRFEAWLDLIQMATFQEENTRLVKGKAITCKKGQLVASVRFLQDRWSWSIHKVSDFIELLRSQNMLLTDKEEGVNRITLINFEKHNEIGFSETEGNSKRNTGHSDSKGLERNKGTAKGTLREQSGNSQGTNIKNDKEGNNEENSFSGAAAPVYSTEDLEMFKAFQDWIRTNAPKVAKMKEPITIAQYLKLRKKVTKEQLKDLLLKMHNYALLLKKNDVAYLTIINWSKRDYNQVNNDNATTEDLLRKKQQRQERTRRIAED